jgi:hypothetical protein
LCGENEKRERNPWVMQEIISNMDERRKWKIANNKEGRKITED